MARLDEKILPELEAIAAKLRRQIERNPMHSKMEKVELEDVKGWIALRRKDAQRGSEPTF